MSDHHHAPSSYDVLIAGAGPVGLLLACELRLAGLSVLVLERAEHSSSPLKALPFGLRGLTVPTVEALDRRGLLDGIAGDATHDGKPLRHAGQFAGIPFDADMIDPSRWPYRLPGLTTRNRATSMERIEMVLATRADALGVTVARGIGFESVAQSEAGVSIRAGDRTFEAKWLVGCDGGRSTVRKAGGFAMVGTDPEFTGYSVQVDLAHPEALPLGRHRTPAGMYFQTQPGHVGMVEFDGGASHRTQTLTLDHVQTVLRRITQTELTVTALHAATSWTDRAVQATDYRRGRVLLAGDAAHIHAPLGGQGLNLGLGDALNLGWKLAAVVRGEAAEELLDTYAAERHPVGAGVLDWSRAQVSLLRPSPQSHALSSILRDLIATRDGATYFAERVWAASQRYDLGDGHPLIGRSVPDFVLRDGTRVAALLRDGRGLLIDFDARAPLRVLSGRWGDKVRYVAQDAQQRWDLGAVLVRPDGIVAWACDGEALSADVVRAASRWFAERAQAGSRLPLTASQP